MKLRINGIDDWVAGLLGAEAAELKNEFSRLTNDEMQTVFTLWAIFRFPIMYGGYFPESDSFSLGLLKNREVLEVNQNSINNKQVYKTDKSVVWMADVPNSNEKYVAMFNLSNKSARVSVNAKQLGVDKSFNVFDLWDNSGLGDFTGKLKVKLPAHGAGLYKMHNKINQ